MELLAFVLCMVSLMAGIAVRGAGTLTVRTTPGFRSYALTDMLDRLGVPVGQVRTRPAFKAIDAIDDTGNNRHECLAWPGLSWVLSPIR